MLYQLDERKKNVLPTQRTKFKQASNLYNSDKTRNEETLSSKTPPTPSYRGNTISRKQPKPD
jgi:hypothetical protein